MSPKKAGVSTQARLPPTQEDPEDGSGQEDIFENFEPSLNQLGNRQFDRVISPPSSREENTPGRVTRSSAGRISTPRAAIIAEQQSRQQEQLDSLFKLVGSLGSDIRSVVSAVDNLTAAGTRNEPRAPSQSEKGKVQAGQRTSEDEHDAEGADDGGSNDDLIGYDDADDYVSHAFYRDRIAEGFSNRAPSRLASNKPAYYPRDDPVLRTLVASKYSAKAAEYSITVANAFFTSVTRAAVDDAITATNNGDAITAAILLDQVANNMAALEDMLRDRMLFLDLSSDPNASATEKDFAQNVLRNEFSPGVQNKGGSTKSNKVFAAYQVQFLKATQFASAKATANRHLASTGGSGASGSASGEGNKTHADPKSKTQLKKKEAARKAANSDEKGGDAREGKAKGKAEKDSD